MATVDIHTMQELEELIENHDIVLVDFWAEWCMPCKMFGPVYSKVSEQYPDIAFAKVNTEAARNLAGAFQIRSIPTLALLRQNVLLYKEAGALPEPHLMELLKKVQDLDMEDISRKIAERDGTTA